MEALCLESFATAFSTNVRRARVATSLIREGRFHDLTSRAHSLLVRRWTSVGVRRNLGLPQPAFRCAVPLEIRPFRPGDELVVFPLNAPELGPSELEEVRLRLALLYAGLSSCYVAVDTRDDTPCYLQWMLGHEENAAIKRHFLGRFPELAPDEVLFENGYTTPRYRGQGVLTAAVSGLCELARARGARHAIAFIPVDRTASRKGYARAGFVPYRIRRDARYLGGLVRRRRFDPVTDGDELVAADTTYLG